MNTKQRQALIDLLMTAEPALWESMAATLVDGPLIPVVEALEAANQVALPIDDDVATEQNHFAWEALDGALDALDPTWLGDRRD